MEDNTHVPSEDADQELEAQFLTVVKKFIPVLRVAKNTSKVLSRLSSVGVDTIVAALEAGKSRFQLDKARIEQSAIGVKVAARQLEEQSRIDQLVFEAIEHNQASDHSVLSEEGEAEERKDEIDDDWIESFRREAADRSLGEMRKTFARILAGEIREPGRSRSRLCVLSVLSANPPPTVPQGSLVTGEYGNYSLRQCFSQASCSGCPCSIAWRKLGQNYLQDEGLGYDRLIKLTENGLLHLIMLPGTRTIR